MGLGRGGSYYDTHRRTGTGVETCAGGCVAWLKGRVSSISSASDADSLSTNLRRRPPRPGCDPETVSRVSGGVGGAAPGIGGIDRVFEYDWRGRSGLLVEGVVRVSIRG